jgi:hypothetical protein
MILTNINTSIELKVRDKFPDISWGYEFIERSDNTLITIDRGSSSDVYETEITLSSEKLADISSVYNFLLSCRLDDNITMSDVNSCESPFGENIDYTNSMEVVILDYTGINHDTFNSYSLSFIMRLVSYPVFKGSDFLPNMKCIRADDNIVQDWRRDVQLSYYNDNYTVEKTDKNDEVTIELSASLNLDDAIAIQNFYRVQRGLKFNYSQTDWGVNIISDEFQVIMTNLQIEYVSPNRRIVNVTLRRQ